MTKTMSFVVIGLALSVTQQSVAQTVDCSGEHKRTSVFFVNGMFTPEDVASAHVQALETLTESDLRTAVGGRGFARVDRCWRR